MTYTKYSASGNDFVITHSFIEKDYTNGDTYMVYCYLVKLIDKEHEPICETETGIIRVASRLQLIKASPYASYNEKAFEWFDL